MTMEGQYTENTLHRLAVSKVFTENTDVVNSLDFTRDGSRLITSSDDESLRIYSVAEGEQKRLMWSRKYGADLVKWTHADDAVLTASKNSWDESIRYLNVQDYRYLRYFRGHRDRVVGLELNAVDDTFLSASLDGTVRLWDLRSSFCEGMIYSGGRPAVACDPTGQIFAVTSAYDSLRLYDARNYSSGPFASFRLHSETKADWSSVSFSPDGKLVLLAGSEPVMPLLNSFTGQNAALFARRCKNGAFTAAFSPCGSVVVSGSDDGALCAWPVPMGESPNYLHRPQEPTVSLLDHASPAGHRCIAFNPRYLMLATSSSSRLLFWVPSVSNQNLSSSSSGLAGSNSSNHWK